MALLPFLAAAALLPLTPVEQADVRCVVVAALTKPPLAPPYLARRGEELLVLSGADIMDRTGRTRQDVAALLTAEIARQKQAPADVAQVRDCNAHVERRLQAETIEAPLPLPRPQR